MNAPECEVDGCERLRDRRDWCNAHYLRWLKNGDPGPATIRARICDAAECSLEGCARAPLARGWCATHYQRWYATGETGPAEIKVARHEGPCAAEACSRPAKRRGWCNLHYKRWARYGDPSTVFPAGWRGTAESRFWPKVNKLGPTPALAAVPGPCWEWMGSLTPGGYGQFVGAERRMMVAHRFAYELLVGPIPEGLQLDHLCRNRKCVSPPHLEPVTQVENMRRGLSISTFNRIKTHCPHGHEYTSENTYITTKGSRICRQCGRDRQARTGKREQK